MAKNKTERSNVQKTVSVKVVADTFGNYKKGEVIQMDKSTAEACIKNEVVAKEGKW